MQWCFNLKHIQTDNPLSRFLMLGTGQRQTNKPARKRLLWRNYLCSPTSWRRLQRPFPWSSCALLSCCLLLTASWSLLVGSRERPASARLIHDSRELLQWLQHAVDRGHKVGACEVQTVWYSCQVIHQAFLKQQFHDAVGLRYSGLWRVRTSIDHVLYEGEDGLEPRVLASRLG